MSEPASTGEPISLLDEATQTKVEQTIAYVMGSAHAPGMIVGIVKDGEIVYAKGFGAAEVETDRPVTTQSMFQIMDTTRTLTATAVIQLLEQGKVDLDERVTAYLPYFQMRDERYKEVTLRHLLTESAGLPYAGSPNQMDEWIGQTPHYDDGALERSVRTLADMTLSQDPGSSHAYYSNWSHEILGDVVAKVSGQLFEEYMQENILTPLRMANSTFLPREANPEFLVTPHMNKGSEVFVNDLDTNGRQHGPSLGLCSSVVDLCRWMLANLNRGELDGQRILQPASFDLLWTPELSTGFGIPWDHVGLGWWVSTVSSGPLVFYNATDVGFTSHIRLAPNDNLGVVVVGNLWTSDFENNALNGPGYAGNIALGVFDMVKNI